jgi:DsbC/DsbD-like thiol-disulfide interchange protein
MSHPFAAPLRAHIFVGAAVLCVTAVLSTSLRAEEGASGWSKGQASSVRLVAAGGLGSDQTYRTAIEIKLSGNGVTYWRTPGESGVPPVVSFAGSTNVGRAELAFPAPSRLEEGGSEVFGYREHVLFPVRVTPKDPRQPVSLVLEMRYAACDKICIPAEAKATLQLDPQTPAQGHAAGIAAAEARVPMRLNPGDKPDLSFQRTGKDAWHVSASPLLAGSDLFAEGPDGWYFDTKVTPAGFDLILAEKPADGRKADVTLTLATPKGAYERVISLDAAEATP